MPLDELTKYWPAALSAGGIFAAALLWRMRGEFATRTDLATLQADLNAYGKRIERMEGDMRHLPTRDDIHALHVEVTSMRGELREMRAENRGVRDILSRTEAALTRHEDIIHAAAARSQT